MVHSSEQDLEGTLQRLEQESDLEALLASLPGLPELEALLASVKQDLEARLLRLAEEEDALLAYLMCSNVAFLASSEEPLFFAWVLPEHFRKNTGSNQVSLF